MIVLRKMIFVVAALLCSALLIFSIPALTILLNQGLGIEEKKETRRTRIERVTVTQRPREEKKVRRRPQRLRSPRRSGKSGTRFAMSLGVEGLGGVSVPMNMTNRSGNGAGGSNDGVDERPTLTAPFNFEPPAQIREREQSASLTLLFCVDVTGKAYDIKVTEEEPTGFGLAEAGIRALQSTQFQPAIKDARPVPFCGMEQPITIKFRE